MINYFRIRHINEDDVERVVLRAGGCRAHPDADQRSTRGADFVLGKSVIELKALDENGQEKSERQIKLAKLFREYEPDRPVIVLDRERLPPVGQRVYDRILEGPVKRAADSARGQLRASREEIPGATHSILFVVNNGYTALNHEELRTLVAHRVRNDSSEISGVIVGGCYFHSDTFDSYFLWPIDYVPIQISYSFPEFQSLREEWNKFANEIMTGLITNGPSRTAKGPVVDTLFTIDGVTYVKPAPPIGRESDFFVRGRPRLSSSGMDRCPPVGLTLPDMTLTEWARFREALSDSPELFGTYGEWQDQRREASQSGTMAQPFVAIPVTADGWLRWCAEIGQPHSYRSVTSYANALFQTKIQALLAESRQHKPGAILPVRYILVVTEEIGQDKANDISHVASVHEFADRDREIETIFRDARMFHHHAIVVGCAHAIARGIGSVLWQMDKTYSWS